MITLSSIVDSARSAYGPQFELHYLHPTMYLVCKDPSFAALEQEARLNLFVEKTGISAADILSPALASTLSVVLVTEEERDREYDFLDVPSPGRHWLPLLDSAALVEETIASTTTPRAVHFYGYKGGQARSTVLAMAAQQLAEDGFKVLVVDVDVEAPSLDVLLNVAATSPSECVMGLVNSDEPVEPLSAYTSMLSGGRIDLLACRPAAEEYNMDFAAFVLRTALDVSALEEGCQKLWRQIQKPDGESVYDLVLFDHRSGLTTSILPVIRACPGPVVLCLRVDEQSRGATALFDVLLRQVADTPGAYVSFSLDPEETRERMLRTHSRKITALLDRLGAAIKRGAAEGEFDEDLPPEDFVRYWVSWFHDRAFLSTPFPKLSDVTEPNRQSLLQLREVLGLSGKPTRLIARLAPSGPYIPRLSPSGSADEGGFIETQDIARLFQPNTGIGYIFGRKGTGKTRLLCELTKRKLGEPLVVAADAKVGGLPSGDTLFSDLAAATADDPEKLWWAVLGAALQAEDTKGATFRKRLDVWAQRASENARNIRPSEIAAIAASLPRRRVFLIDGIETAFRSSQLIQNVEALFRFLLTVQSDSKFADRVVIRLFLRTDLARRAIQNVEQQTSGRRLDLTWNTQSIFNFVLSRIGQLPWFQSNFPEACNAIAAERGRISAGLLTASEYEPLLLLVFPRHIRRNNLQTLTFLKTYFSDAAGDDEARAAFYPRLFDAFLGYIADPTRLPHGAAPSQPIEEERVHQGLVLAAHDAASRKFLDEVKQELSVLLDLAPNAAENDQRVSELLGAFEGFRTPFQLDECVKKLRTRVRRLEPGALRDALHRMREIGMFEDRPGYEGWWRAGRLFKSALRMKYVR